MSLIIWVKWKLTCAAVLSPTLAEDVSALVYVCVRVSVCVSEVDLVFNLNCILVKQSMKIALE